MGDDYYNIDAILADQQKLPCIFKCDVKGLGYLDGNNDVDLRRDTKVELPFWLVETLAKAPDLFEVAGLPKYYGTRVRSALNASPTSIDFRSLCPYYYMFGVRLVTLLKDDPLTEMLGKAFKARLQLIMDYAQNGSSQEQTEFLQMLDETERELYRAGYESATALRKWNNRALKHLAPMPLLRRMDSTRGPGSASA